MYIDENKGEEDIYGRKEIVSPSYFITTGLTVVITEELRSDFPGLTDQQIAEKFVQVILNWAKHSYRKEVASPSILTISPDFP